jgi:integrase
VPKLTKRTIDALPILPRDTVHWDDELPGFGLRIKPSGVRSFLIQYRNSERKSCRYTIGKYDPLTPEQARKLARRLLGGVADGKDPAGEKKEALQAITVKELCEQYEKEMVAGRILDRRGRPKKASTIETDKGRIKRHIIPLLGTIRVRNLDLKQIDRFMHDVAAGKTKADEKTKKRGRAIVEGGRGTATRTAGLLGGILSFAVKQGVIDRNPAQGLKRFPDTRKQRFLSVAEWKALGAALRHAEVNGINSKAIAAIRLAALTGLRKGEGLALKRPEIDPSGTLTLTDTKTGASVRPIGRAAIDLLASVPKNGEYVFPADKGKGHFVGLPRVAAAIFKDAGLADVSMHTLRHSFASVANGLGYTDPTIAAMLGHSTNTVTGRYIHHLDTALIAAADKVSAHIAGLIGLPAKAQKKPAKRRGRITHAQKS